MKAKICLYITATWLLLTGTALSVVANTLYIYDNPTRRLFDLQPAIVAQIGGANQAISAVEDVFAALTDEQKAAPFTLDSLSLFMEAATRQSASAAIDGELGAGDDVLRRLADESARTMKTLELLAEKYGVDPLRGLRQGVLLTTNGIEPASVSFAYPLDGIGADTVTLQNAEAYLSIVAGEVHTAATFGVGGGNVTEIISPAPSAPEVLLKYWSIWEVLILSLAWLFSPLLLKKRPHWAFLVGASVAFLGLNIAVVKATEVQVVKIAATDTGGVTVELGGESATLGIFTDVERPDELVMFDNDGNPLSSKYNPATGAIEARIYESGAYRLAVNLVNFTDLGDKSEEMRYAIYTLASRGLMDGADAKKFVPDRAITRAEFLSVVLNAMGLIDEEAESPFGDVLRGDWFYKVAASAYEEGLVTGYDDGTFRGNEPIPKVQMAVVAANLLLRSGYNQPQDVTDFLARYADADTLPEWAADKIALAARAGIVPERVDGVFDPDGVMTRGDAAVMLYRLFTKIW